MAKPTYVKGSFRADQYKGLAADGAIPAHTGKTIYVHASGPQDTGLEPFVTDIDSAIGLCRASRGDMVVVLEGHTETITSAGAIALDVAGVQVIGLGTGNKRPVVTITSTDNTGSITISANDTAFKNIVVVGNDDGLTNALNVTGNRVDLDVETQDTSSAVEMATAIRLDTADGAVVNWKHVGFAAGNAMTAGIILDTCVNVNICVDFKGKASTSVIDMQDGASSDVYITGYMFNSGTTDYTKDVTDTITGSTWYAEIQDGAAGAAVSGGSADALAAGDLGDIATNVSAILTDTGTTLPATLGTPAGADMSTDIAAIKAETAVIAALPQCVEKTDGAVLSGNDDLFVISGGPVRAKIVGIVTTVIGGAANMDLQIVTTSPAGTTNLNAAPVAIDTDAAGTSYHNVGATSVFTPVTAGAFLADPVTVEETEFILPAGTVHARGSAAQTGVIAWYMTYTPLSPNSVVTAAA